ncbi:MAG TPA: RNA methyltransferase [Ohtaekwangia sp.]|uniref:RNA methyltransferase n=1 Tax=Ohtaekwangia sp. TaxID=2066019 RepID=UPI002F92063A
MKKLKLDELGRISVDEFREADKIPVCIVLDNIRSLHNVGSSFRTADAFRIEKIYLTGITGTPPHREIQKTALGATESVEWHYVSEPADIVKQLKTDGYKITIIEQTSESIALQNFTPAIGEKYCLVFGNEVNGVSDEVIALGDIAIEIPQVGTKHSLNVSVCLGIVTWEIFRKLVLK